MDAKVAVGAGMALGVLVVGWQFVAAAAGLTAVFPLVATMIELVVLVCGLWLTRTKQGYAAQVGSGVTMAAVSLVLIGPGAMAVGASMADVIAGVVGTLVSGIVIAAIAGYFLKAPAVT